MNLLKPAAVAVLGLSATFSSAQLYVEAEQLYVSTGGLYINGDLQTASTDGDNATITIADTLAATGHVTLDSGTAVAGGGFLALTGTAQQNLDFADATIPQLLLNNSNGASLSADATVSGTLQLEDGLLDIANYDLTVGVLGTGAGFIAGQSATRYIKTSGTGELRRFASGTTEFPIGADSYTPITINPTAPDTLGARAENTAYASYNPIKFLPFTNNVVQSAWYVSGGEATTADMDLSWPAAREFSDFARDSSTVVFYDDDIDRWIVPTTFQNAGNSGGLYSQSITGAKNFDTYYAVFEAQDCGGPNTTYVYNNGWNTDPNGTANFCDSIAIVAGNASLTDIVYARALTIAPNASIDLGGNTMVVEKKATVQADSTGYGQLIGKVEGAADWQTYLASASPRWYNNAFPVSGKVSNISGALINITNDVNSHNIYKYDPTTDSDIDNEGDWVMAAATDDLGTTAYQIYLSNNFGGNSATLTATGDLLDGAQAIPVTVNGQNTEGWNYIPNPYPSALDFDELTTDNPTIITKTYYIQSGPPNTSVFQSYNATLGTGTLGGTKNLATGQGFFVEATASGNLNLDNSQRNLNTPDLYRVAGSAGQFLKLKAGRAGSDRFDETVIGFDAQYSNGKDNSGADAKKMMNHFFPNLYTEIAGKAFVHNGLDENFTSHSEPLFFAHDSAGTFKIQVAADYLPHDWTVDLEDLQQQKTVDLRAGGYSFSHGAGNAAGRFVLHFNKSAVGMAELENASGIFAFAENGLLNINMENHDAPATVKLYDLRGALLAEADKTRGGKIIQIKMKNQARGVYLLKVQDASGQAVYSQKILN